jgi:hypothetical protein
MLQRIATFPKMELTGQTHASTVLIPGKNAGSHWTECCAGARASLDVSERRNNSIIYQDSNPG